MPSIILKYKDEITNWAGAVGVLAGAIAIYFKDTLPKTAGICSSLALLCGGIVAFFTGKVTK
jgi:hypothetical protein